MIKSERVVNEGLKENCFVPSYRIGRPRRRAPLST